MRPKPLNQLREYLIAAEIKVVSVDVFDTLLLRDTTPEMVRFLAISRLQVQYLNTQGIYEVSAQDFYLLRREAARTVYSTKSFCNGGREAAWTEIFELIFSALKLPINSTWLKRCADIELRYEIDRLSLNKPLSKLLDEARQTGKAIVCVSDMYLTSSQIKHLINTVAGGELNMTVYSSADYGFGKGCGAMYHTLAEELSVTFSEIVHCGDNWYADFQMPQSLGIRAKYLPRSIAWRMIRRARTHHFDKKLSAL